MAITKELLEEVNYYGKIAKERQLTDDEKQRQKEVREKYLQQFRSGMKQVLDNVDVLKKIPISKSHFEVERKLKGKEGIFEIKKIGFNMTEVTYNIKNYDANELLNIFIDD